jgi:proprotein convertase subtilisin/kexin type 5
LCVNYCKFCENGTICIQCRENYELLPEGLCRKICSLGFYLSESDNQCYSCAPNCAYCSSSKNCSKCLNGFLFYKFNCYQECPQSTFKEPGFDVCSECPSNCRSCKSDKKCSLCISNFYLVENGKAKIILFKSGNNF